MDPVNQTEKLPHARIYQIALGLFLILAIVLSGLHRLQKYWLEKSPRETEHAPLHSPLQEVEFESGELAQRLRATQLQRLNSYTGDRRTQKFIEVPIERAFEQMLEEKKK